MSVAVNLNLGKKVTLNDIKVLCTISAFFSPFQNRDC